MINLDNWQSQLHKGYLELCVLSLLHKNEAYGGKLLNDIQQAGLSITEGTLYPLLNRMQRNGWLESHWQTPEAQGHPRRYYRLSAESLNLLPQMQASFISITQTLERITHHG